MSQFLPFDKKLLRQFRVPLVLFGVGYNQNLKSSGLSSRENESVQLLANRARLITVRDTLTFDFLKNLDVNSTPMCDPAIFLSEIDSNSIPNSGSQLKIGINLASHGWDRQSEVIDSLVEIYAKLIKKVRKNKGTQFYYFMHHPDEELCLELFKEHGVKFDSVIRTDDSRVLKGAYAKVDLTVSMMLHSTVLAFGAGTPSICIGYDKKNAAFMELTKQYKRYVDINTLNDDILQKMFDETISDIVNVKKEILARKRSIQTSYIKLAKEVLSLAKQNKK